MSSGVNKFQLSVKVGGNIIVVGGDNADEFEANVKSLFGGEGWAIALADFDTRVKRLDEPATPQQDQQFDNAQQAIQNGFGAAPGLGSTPPAGKPDFVPPNAQPAQEQTAPMCAHGPRSYVAKANWKAWFCCLPKDAQGKCDPVWVK